MLKRILFMEEKNGGYKFDREAGIVEFLEGEKFKGEIGRAKHEEEKFDIIPLPANASEIALSAPLVVWHETTHTCNLNCKDCGRDRIYEDELNLEEIKEVYADLAGSGVFE